MENFIGSIIDAKYSIERYSKEGFIVYRDDERDVEINDKKIKFLPFWKFSLLHKEGI